MNKQTNYSDLVIPDFIIGGAMKSGTTTLHYILQSHPDVEIPDGELHFFDIDNVLQHNDFNFYDIEKDRWIYQRFDMVNKEFLNWYGSKFQQNTNCVIGEDSTTYLSSHIAAQRIAELQNPVKLIFILRQPSERAFSHYLHNLRSGRAKYTFEDTLIYENWQILQRSLYKEQLEYYYSLIPRERIMIILFEDLVIDTSNVIENVCNFLNIDFNRIDPAVFNSHENKSCFPKFYRLQLLRNRLFESYSNQRYVDFVPQTPGNKKDKTIFRLIDKIHNKINPAVVNETPKIKTSTKLFLDDFFKVQLSGIDELCEMEIMQKWFS